MGIVHKGIVHASIAVIGLICGLTAGCTALRTGTLEAAPRPTAATTPSASTPGEIGNASAASLAAVAAFLNRTAEYQMGGRETVPMQDYAAQARSTPGRSTSDRAAQGGTPPYASARTVDGLPPAIPEVVLGAAAATPPVFRPHARSPRSHAGHDDRSKAQAVANAQVTVAGSSTAARLPALPVVEAISIRGDAPAVPSISAIEATRATNQPLDTRASRETLSPDRWLAELEAQADQARDFDSEWRLRLADLAFSRDAAAAEFSSSMAEGTRRILSALVRAAVAIRGAARDPSAEPVAREALTRVDDLRDVLADRVDPQVSALALCRKVVNFGAYEEMADTDFIAGRPVQTIVYNEVRNFRTEEADNGHFRTRIGSRLEVLTRDGRSIWRHEEPEIIDLCRRRRTDFFVAQRITLPPTLPAGEYVLKVLVEDKLSGRADEETLSFTIHDALSVAQTP
ncbi:MAG: hypothetical protein ACE5EX_00945 [Phycisphaerae bacterium]